ncbi:MAG: DUF190 domain-containing protein [Acidobacteria bacterium]|jgi:PII-like signaling protein|nr:MAG: DUF190 domain-containing protein [Acidobacteriota bacterium]
MRVEEALLLRLFFGEGDKHKGKPLYKYIVELCREKGIAGATVFRGVLGYGKSSVIHGGGVLRLSSDLPIVVEVIDSEDKIREILPELSSLVKDRIVTLERVRVIRLD